MEIKEIMKKQKGDEIKNYVKLKSCKTTKL